MIYFSVSTSSTVFSPAQEEHIVFKDPVLKNSQRHVRKGSSVQRSFGVKAKICYHHTRLRALVRSGGFQRAGRILRCCDAPIGWHCQHVVVSATLDREEPVKQSSSAFYAAVLGEYCPLII